MTKPEFLAFLYMLEAMQEVDAEKALEVVRKTIAQIEENKNQN